MADSPCPQRLAWRLAHSLAALSLTALSLTALNLTALTACDDEPARSAQAADASMAFSVDASADAAVDARPSLACDTLEDPCAVEGELTCGRLFGRPSDRTGLPEGLCAAECACGGGLWSPPPITDEVLNSLRGFELVNPPELPPEDPYLTPEAFVEEPERVCAIRFDANEPSRYALQTFGSPEAAREAGARITHFGACGLCSSLQDLAVYIATPDLTQPVRRCGVRGLTQGAEAQRGCIAELGFTAPCAAIWSYNTTHTGEVCRDICLPLLNAPYHTEGGAPNDCIQCDEEMSGPVFKAVAGRTRRNSGLPTALCRPCGDVRPVDHQYGE